MEHIHIICLTNGWVPINGNGFAIITKVKIWNKAKTITGVLLKSLGIYYHTNDFIAFVEQTDKSKLAIQQSLDKLELLKKSLMQEYFG